LFFASSAAAVIKNNKSTTKKISPTKKKTTGKSTKSSSSSQDDTAATMLKFLSKMAALNQNQVKESELLKATGYAGADSKGYRFPLKELMKTKGWLYKDSSGNTKTKDKVIGLTDEGRDHCINIGLLTLPKEVTTQEEHLEQVKTLLDKAAKTFGATPTNITKVWNLLMDGQYHTIKELLDIMGYAGIDSKGYRHAIKSFDNQGLIEKDNKAYRFADKMYKFSPRP
jgi:hypothetical protein